MDEGFVRFWIDEKRPVIFIEDAPHKTAKEFLSFEDCLKRLDKRKRRGLRRKWRRLINLLTGKMPCVKKSSTRK